MTDLEIPLKEDRGKRYRFFEMLPGLISWSVLLSPLIISLFNPVLAEFLIIGYLLLWFAKAVGLDIRAVQGYHTMKQHMQLPWGQMLEELEAGEVADATAQRPQWHYDNLLRLQVQPAPVKPSEIIHAVIIASYNESREVIEPTVQAVRNSNYNMQQVMLVFAYEGRDGAQSEAAVQALAKEYGPQFRYAVAVKHPLEPNQVRGKGGNISYAARRLQHYLAEQKIDPKRVVVTTLDSDNRPHKQYLAALTYTFCASPDPIKVSYQPIPMFTNNIWDAPAPMRVVATGNSFWMTVTTMRPHILRNFSAHAQSMQALIDTDFWSVRTIVEDGHQFWRTYFRYDGQHEVYPIYLPIYQDAVLAKGYIRTLKAQFIQMRRWAWGASDVAYVVEKGFFTPNKLPRGDLWTKLLRLLEGHVSWATAPLILAFAGYIPLLFHPTSYAANELPIVASRIQTIALAGIIVTLFFSLKTLPPKPERYKKHRNLFMIVQWVLLPVTTICYSALSGLTSQTRLIFKRYLDKFDVTEKAVVTEDRETIV